MTNKTIFLFLFSISFFLTSCSTYSDGDKLAFEKEIKEHIATLNMPFEQLENGMFIAIHDQGEVPTIKMSDRVTFCYEGSFLNNEVFQVIEEEDALSYKTRELIIGWQDALTLVGNGAELTVILPPYLAYGNKNTELIPPNSIVKYRLKVLSVE